MRPPIGVTLPVASFAGGLPEGISSQDAAAHAEQVGLDSVWVGDHLMTGSPSLDGPLLLAAAAAATSRVRIGLGVFVPALRPLAWAAKQVATLQRVSSSRLLLGVGSGGPWPAEWEIVGIPYWERGRRTDTALELLPALLRGDAVALPDVPGWRPEASLSPAVPFPPLWIGGTSAAARRRSVAHQATWFPSMLTPTDLAGGVADLGDRAASAGAPTPAVAVGLFGSIGPGGPAKEELATGLVSRYGLPPEQANEIVLTGDASAVADRLNAFTEVGASHLVLGLIDQRWEHQLDVLAEATRSLDP